MTQTYAGETLAWNDDPERLPEVSVVIPTFNEAENIDELLAQLSDVLPHDLRGEVIFVDDSSDSTPEAIAEAAPGFAVPISMKHRDDPVGGLGGAVVEGLRLARAPWVVVMDGDLQHPPAMLPVLIDAGQRASADLVVASRYTDGGSRSGLGTLYRTVVSGASTLLAKLAFTRSLRGISDPMSGFFAVRRDSLDVETLRPLGYKILLELVVRSRPERVAEVPYQFGERFAGSSKSTVREGLRFLQHLLLLRVSSTRGRLLGFGAIGLSGFLPNLAVLWLLVSAGGVHYVPAAVLANQVAIVWNFALVDRFVYSHRGRHGLAGRFGRFLALNNADLLVRIPMLSVLVSVLHAGVLTATVVTLLAMFVVRFVVTDRVIYGRTADEPRS